MRYGLEQGPTERKIVQDSYRYGMPLPKSIQNAPTLTLGLQLYHQAFLDLHSSRPSSNTSAIPINAIYEYCDHNGIRESDQRSDLVWLVARIDQWYLEWEAGRNGRPQGLQKANGHPC